MLVMLTNAGMMPLFFDHCTFMLLPSKLAGSLGLPYVYSFCGAGARVFVDAFLLILRCMGFVLRTENVFEGRA